MKYIYRDAISNKALLAVLAVLNTLFSMSISFIYVSFLGVGVDSDIVFSALSIPLFFSVILGPSLTNIITPYIMESKEKASFCVQLIVLAVSVSIPLMALLVVFSDYVGHVIFPVLMGESRSHLSDSIKIASFCILFISTNTILTSKARSEGRLYFLECAGILSSVISLVILIINKADVTPSYVVFVTFIRYITLCILMLPIVGRPTNFYMEWGNLKRIIMQIRYAILGGMIYKQGPFLDRVLLSFAPSGSLTLFLLSYQVWGVGLTLMDRLVVAPFMLDLNSSKEVKGGEYAVYIKYLKGVFIFSLVVFGLYIFPGGTVMTQIALYFYPGINVEYLYRIMLCMGGIYIFGSLGQLSTVALYCRYNVKGVTYVALFSFFISVVFKLFLFGFFGVYAVIFGCVLYQLLNYLMQHRMYVSGRFGVGGI